MSKFKKSKLCFVLPDFLRNCFGLTGKFKLKIEPLVLILSTVYVFFSTLTV